MKINLRLRYLQVDKNRIPYRFTVRLVGETFVFEIHYNFEGDFFTIDLYKGAQILCTDKITYGRYLFSQLIDAGQFPIVYIIPLDISDVETIITWQNFMGPVKPYIFTSEELELTSGVGDL